MDPKERKALRSFVLDRSVFYDTHYYLTIMNLLEEYDDLLFYPTEIEYGEEDA
jgi:hypothetical protein